MKRTVRTLIYDGVAALDVTGPADVFAAATVLLERKGKHGGYMLEYCGMTKSSVRTHSALMLQPESVAGKKDAADVFIVPGTAYLENVSAQSPLIEAVQGEGAGVERLVSVCTGAFLLAHCGLLDGRRATTHWMFTERLAREFPSIRVEPDALYIRDGHIGTSGGVTAGIDLALALVEEDHGPELALDVARMLLLYRRRPGSQSQFSDLLSAQQRALGRFVPLCRWIESNLNLELSVDMLAEHVSLSPRHFARVFRDEVGDTPGHFVETCRVDRVRELLESGESDMSRLAGMVGFDREERMRRTFTRHMGVSPREYRMHFLTK